MNAIAGISARMAQIQSEIGSLVPTRTAVASAGSAPSAESTLGTSAGTRVASEQAGWESRRPWTWIAAADLNAVGIGAVVAFLAVWVVAVLAWRPRERLGAPPPRRPTDAGLAGIVID